MRAVGVNHLAAIGTLENPAGKFPDEALDWMMVLLMSRPSISRKPLKLWTSKVSYQQNANLAGVYCELPRHRI
jgi:hypothetical protein